MTTPSLADNAVTALALVHDIGGDLNNNHPMRHVVRGMKRSAEQILADAMRQATEIAHQSEQLIKDYNEATGVQK